MVVSRTGAVNASDKECQNWSLDASQKQSRSPHGPTESQQHPRLRTEADVRIDSRRAGRVPARAVDISEAEICALVTAELLIGEIVYLSIQLPSGSLDILAKSGTAASSAMASSLLIPDPRCRTLRK